MTAGLVSSRWRELDGDGLQAGFGGRVRVGRHRVEDRKGRVLRGDQQFDLGAGEHHGLGSLGCELLDLGDEDRPTGVGDDAPG